MKNTFASFLFLILFMNVSAQSADENKSKTYTKKNSVKANENNTNTLFNKSPKIEDKLILLDFPEQMPEFPGGDNALITYLKENIIYPKSAMKINISGRISIQFIVDELGKITDAKVANHRDGFEELEKEALRVVNAMPNWKPAKQNGRTVAAKYFLPINICLEE